MGRTPCCEKNGIKKGPWTPEEDKLLVDYIHKNGCGNWRTLPNNAGLQRCGKSCRLRWTNYLRPDIKRGSFSFQEEETIIHLHTILGNKWSAIAARLPGRTDNEIKNYWNTHIKKRMQPSTNYPQLMRLTSSLIQNQQITNDRVQPLLQMQTPPFNEFMMHEPAHQLTHYDDVAGFGSQLAADYGYYGSGHGVASSESCVFQSDTSSFGLQSVLFNISTPLSSPTTLQ